MTSLQSNQGLCDEPPAEQACHRTFEGPSITRILPSASRALGLQSSPLPPHLQNIPRKVLRRIQYELLQGSRRSHLSSKDPNFEYMTPKMRPVAQL